MLTLDGPFTSRSLFNDTQSAIFPLPKSSHFDKSGALGDELVRQLMILALQQD